MTNAVLLVVILTLIFGYLLGYFVGLNQSHMINKLRTLEDKLKHPPEPEPEPEKPTVVMGAYQPPKEISNLADKKRGAGLVETKTPELLDWENSNEIAKLEHS